MVVKFGKKGTGIIAVAVEVAEVMEEAIVVW